MPKLNFDARTVDPAEDFAALPNGHYAVLIESSEFKATKTGGQMLVLTMQVIEGKYKGRKLFERLNLENANETAVEIANRTLSSICHATGVMAPEESEELHNIPILVRVACVKRKDNGELTNEIKAYKSAKDGASLLDEHGNDRAGFTAPEPGGNDAPGMPGSAPGRKPWQK